jgi:integrase
MTARNRNRLWVLQDHQNLQRLINLPDMIFAYNRSMNTLHRHELEREDALAIAILLHCPIRVQNLSRIHMQQNLHLPRDGRAFLVFEEDEVKNNIPLEFEVPRDVLRLIDYHLAKRSPNLCPRDTPWLFPRRDGNAAVGSGELAGRVARHVLKETGLEVNAQLFRHFAVMLLLDAPPGAYESGSRLLGHSSSSHTISVYAGMETRAATKAFADLVATNKARR